MLTRLLGFVDAVVRGATYIAVLIMGLSLAVLGVYVVTLLCYRLGQFLNSRILCSAW